MRINTSATTGIMRESGFATIAFFLIIVGGTLSYAESTMGVLKLSGYAMAIAGAIVLFLTHKRLPIRELGIILLFTGSMWALQLVQIIFLESASGSILSNLQVILQPLIFFLLIGGGRAIHRVRKTPIKNAILIMAGINALVGLLGSFGILSSVPFFGKVTQGRFIFGTSLPSSNGLAMNVNYFATVQASLAFLYAWLSHQESGHNGLTRQNRFWFFLLLASSVIGSSRGVLLASGVGLGTVVFIDLIAGVKGERKLARKAILLTIATAICAGLVFPDKVSDLLRLERGLNARDVIWAEALESWWSSPIIGLGGEARSVLIEDSSGEVQSRSLHSGYLTVLQSGGIVLFVLSYLIIPLAFIIGLGPSRRLWRRGKWAVAILTFYLVNSIFRNFAIGGVGLLPVIAAVAISAILFMRRENNYAKQVHLSGNCGKPVCMNE